MVTGDNVGNVVLLSTSGEEVCMQQSPLQGSSWLMCFPTLQRLRKVEQVLCRPVDESTHCVGGEKSSTSAIH